MSELVTDDAPKALTGPQIAELVDRYRREIARYEKSAMLVGERMRRELREAGIKHMVSHRPKHPADLAEKLERKATQKPDVYVWDKLHKNLGDVVTDLAGCRVVVYSPEDEESVARMVPRTFLQPERVDAPSQRRRGIDVPYWATHALVHPYGPNDAPEMSVDGAVCELQIVTVAAHLFNEIEHDITYKEAMKNLPANDDERQLLDELRGVVRVADRLVTDLMTYRQKRTVEATAVIADAEDLRYALRNLAGRRIDGGDLGRLLKILEGVLDSVTPAALRQLGMLDERVNVGRRLLGSEARDFDEVALSTVGLRETFREEIDEISKGWRGPKTSMRRALELARDLEATKRGDLS